MSNALKKIAARICFAVILICCGCQESQNLSNGSSNKSSSRLLLTVDFEQGREIIYNIVSERNISLDLDPAGKYSKGGKAGGKLQHNLEKLEMTMAYMPVEIDKNGCTAVEVKCISAKVTRSSSSGRANRRKDAVETFAGESYKLKITPTGRVMDYSPLTEVIKKLGKAAFTDSKRKGIKDPDMIMDFIAAQWYFWDAIATIEKPLKGVKRGQRWNSKLLAPMPFVSKIGRDVEYQLADYNDSNAEIISSYSLSKTFADVPMPYGGVFQMRGTFGFLRDYEVMALDGSGEQIYDIDRGIITSNTQKYQAKVKASIFGLGSSSIEPNIIVDQTIAIQLVE